MPTTLITPAAGLPMTLEDVKTHLRMDGNAEDSLVTDYIRAATEYIEAATGIQIMRATWEATSNGFPTYCDDDGYMAIRLPRPPLVSVVSVSYVDTDGTTQTLTEGTDYAVDTRKQPGRVVPYYGASWPTARDQPNSVTVRYVAGYLATADVPHKIKQAIRYLVTHYDRFRQPVISGTIQTEVDQTLQALLAIEKHWTFGD